MQMKNQKAQVTIFIIIAILIIAGVVCFYLEIEKRSLFSPIQNFGEVCIKDIGQDALYFIGQNGGYFFLKKNLLKVNSLLY